MALVRAVTYRPSGIVPSYYEVMARETSDSESPRGWVLRGIRGRCGVKMRSLTLTRDLIYGFAALTGDDNRLHTDPEFMQDTEFGDVIAHGMLLQSLGIGLFAELGVFQGTTIALLAADCRFQRTAVPGDEIRVELTINNKRISKSLGAECCSDHARDQPAGRVLLETDPVSLMRTAPASS